MQLSSISINDLSQIAEQILAFSANSNVIVFKGDLGAGKTALVKQLCTLLAVKDVVSSPTYSLVNEYKSGNKTIFHFDLYRLEKVEELNNIGFAEYFDQEALILIEWPEIILDFLTDYIMVQISVSPNNARTYNITKITA